MFLFKELNILKTKFALIIAVIVLISYLLFHRGACFLWEDKWNCEVDRQHDDAYMDQHFDAS